MEVLTSSRTLALSGLYSMIVRSIDNVSSEKQALCAAERPYLSGQEKERECVRNVEIEGGKREEREINIYIPFPRTKHTLAWPS